VRTSKRFVVLVMACSVLTTSVALAEVELPSVISNHMVLQRDMPLPIWGKAEPGEKVTVSIQKQSAEAVANPDGRWQVKLDAMQAGGPFGMTIAGANTLTLKDILVGEVWICSGQSNMQMTVKKSKDAAVEIKAADYPKIRLFTAQRTIASQPRFNVPGEWSACTPETAAPFSAVAYYFGRHLHKKMDVPVGLIHTSWGGTPAESWTSMPVLQADPVLQPILARWRNLIAGYPKKLDHWYETRLAAWRKQADRAESQGRSIPKAPDLPKDPRQSPHRAAGLYNAMIHPFIPYGIKGAIWYQGESNAKRAYQYRTLFPAMIRNWRTDWGEGDFTFLFVQLANCRARKAEPVESDWAELREAQTMTLSLPNTGMAVIIDIGEADDIHPKNKQDVGARLALGARAIAYGEQIVYSGPVYDSMTVEGDRIRLRFKHVGGGLRVEGGAALKGFAVAGADRQFVWAKATIDGDTVVVGSDKVAQPVAVRYAWATNPECNLYNQAGLPASPFRTDDWPGVTVDAR